MAVSVAAAAESLYSLASDQSLDAHTGIEMADRLTRLGDPRGTEVLYTFAINPQLGRYTRSLSAEHLARAGDPRGLEVLRSFNRLL